MVVAGGVCLRLAAPSEMDTVPRITRSREFSIMLLFSEAVQQS